jgi:cysteine sulfinate desulfinase/cysteine desulfurase-like protein
VGAHKFHGQGVRDLLFAEKIQAYSLFYGGEQEKVTTEAVTQIAGM